MFHAGPGFGGVIGSRIFIGVASAEDCIVLPTARYCTVCATVERESHAQKNRHGHPLPPLSQEENTDLERRWREEMQLGAEAKERRLAQDREEENRRRQKAARATQSVFRMDFGKHTTA